MKPGKAYKLASLAASHRVKAMRHLDHGDHENAKKEDVAYLDCVESISSMYRQQMMRFFDECVNVTLDANAKGKGQTNSA